MDTNYFVCTLGEAAYVPGGRPFRNANHLIDKQSEDNPHLPAVGFYRTETQHGSRFGHSILSFKQVREGVITTAELLLDKIDGSTGGTIALLCSSSPEFFFTWLAFIRLGHSVLLIAPECSPSAIAQLCWSCGVSILLVDQAHEQLGTQATEEPVHDKRGRFRCMRQPFDGYDVFSLLESRLPVPSRVSPAAKTNENDIAYLHHTSGTSSGIPKPIPQSHRGAVAVLPALEGRNTAMFTTTPLYHGGPADIFRAWASDAMIWLFPSKDVPITASNIVKCLECADEAASRKPLPPISFFASVPYVLQMMAADLQGLKWLQNMNLVGVGGAALSKDIGDQLVDVGVHLVSRFGSAECGFLLSSHRQYEKDKDWQYLRQSDNAPQFRFEAQEAGLSELVVGADWPHLAKMNREDGSYATSDLFEPHGRIDKAWKYHSRADSQMTLLSGKKFDPAPIEQALVTSVPSVADALVFGNGKMYPGALLFRSKDAGTMTDEAVVQAVFPVLEKVTRDSQQTTRITRAMLVPMPYAVTPLEKSSKGTILRNRAELRYVTYIDQAYDQPDNGSLQGVSDDELPAAIRQVILDTISPKSQLDESTDLFSFGIDSVASIQIRRRLQQLLAKDRRQLPISVVEDCGTLERLVSYVAKLRNGQVASVATTLEEQHACMFKLVEEYSTAGVPQASSSVTNGITKKHYKSETVLLTGATGGLGAHVLSQLIHDKSISKVYCLVRGSDDYAARERVDKALTHRKLTSLTDPQAHGKVEVVQASLGDPKLSLGDELYRRIGHDTTMIMHLAWTVNFRLKLGSFVKDSIAGLRNLIDLALSSPRSEYPKFTFCSSTASTTDYKGDVVPEAIVEEPSTAGSTGYAQSKWVAEHICYRASQDPRLHGRVTVFRVGQLSGDSKTGVWNGKEAWPLLLNTAKVLGSLPNLEAQMLDWLPVDIAAAAMIEGAKLADNSEQLQFFHIANDNQGPSWKDLLRWLAKLAVFNVVSANQWIEQLDKAAEGGSDHPALHLRNHWRKTLLDHRVQNQLGQNPTRFDMRGTKSAIPTLRDVEPIDEQYFRKLWKWIEREV